MHRINYAGDSLLTGTAIAHAVLHYAKELALEGASDTVEIPTIGEAGQRETVELLIGPASELFATSERSSFPDPEESAVLQELAARVEKLGRGDASAPLDASELPRDIHGIDEF